LAADLVGYLSFRSCGAEVRGNSTFDTSLWDMFSKLRGLPIAQLRRMAWQMSRGTDG
jgi:L-alanine-DL-glutamate epimerase-like enolase superfamily enzyme